MLRFFEAPETDHSWWPAAAAPSSSAPQRGRNLEPPHQGNPGSDAPASSRTTVNFVKGRWRHPPLPTVGDVSPSPSSNASSSDDSFTSFSGGINWQRCLGFHHQTSDPSLASFQGGESLSMASDARRRSQHDVCIQKRGNNVEDEESNYIKNMQADHKRQKLHLLPSFESAEMKPTTARQSMKAPVKKSQKLGDKITSLQQLVSPFGKTDTASVLHEATICIKALHEHIIMLSRPLNGSNYSAHGIQGNGGSRRSRLHDMELCIAPISMAINCFTNQECMDIFFRKKIN